MLLFLDLFYWASFILPQIVSLEIMSSEDEESVSYFTRIFKFNIQIFNIQIFSIRRNAKNGNEVIRLDEKIVIIDEDVIEAVTKRTKSQSADVEIQKRMM
jgi:hypothetical protein